MVSRYEFIDFWIVLHGAGAERIKPDVDAKIGSGESCEMPDYLHLGHLWKSLDFITKRNPFENIISLNQGSGGIVRVTDESCVPIS